MNLINASEFNLLLHLLIAHFLADFALQPHEWVEDKRLKKIKSVYLYLHILVVSVLSTFAFLLFGKIYLIPLFIIVISHLIIDCWKSYQKDRLIYFFIDQFLHISILIGVWISLLADPFYILQNLGFSFSQNSNLCLILLGYSICIWPLGIIIGAITRTWKTQISPEFESESLKDAGKWIGIFERILIFTFIISAHFDAIGFLITAKSILRFNDLRKQHQKKETEYILIGTLISFISAIATGMLILQWLE